MLGYHLLPTNEGSFEVDIEDGLTSSNFDLHSNLDENDHRAGLKDKEEILKIMKKQNVSFDEARLIRQQRLLKKNNVDPTTGLPMDPKFVSFGSWSEVDLDVSITDISFRMSIQQALQANFGLVGASIAVDVLDWDEANHIGIIKVPQSELVTVWSALSMHQFLIAGQPCAFDILDSSAHLISLADHSRTGR
ncbi:hypothetical protein EC973_003978 [Apophysomyces ossiformis]|uniref:Ribonucleases P/MRP subunit Pop8-like domain-containing protein n=1 Tax=Apophysomyces ossiformis TaxID=679940 RepID=A0A8H7BF35_9FUNG|nr:hypothetical protein EC973_003978 [Apophysomyces ossiformis]